MLPVDMPFEFKSLQFLVRYNLAISINKSQGRSLKIVELHLTQHCFSHDQLCEGCSKNGNGNRLFVFTLNGNAKNVVYPAAW